MNFKKKYLKYKSKYLNLKNLEMFGSGNPEDILLEMTILAGLGFNLPIEDKKILNVIPDNTFGVFVTVRRNNIIDNYDIHGCIGNWDNNLKKISAEKLYEMSKSVSYSATWEDSRAKTMNNIKSILQDGNTIYELDFMLQPVLDIDPNTGVISNGDKFDNNKYGLIYNKGSVRATYLPHVFPDSTWDNIKDRLIDKSKNTSNYNDDKSSQNYSFKSYTIKQIKTDLFTFITKLKYVSNQFIKWIQNNYGGSIPYIRSTSNKIIRDENQYVRNVATINDILQFKNKLSTTVLEKKEAEVLEKMEADLTKYYKIFNEDKLSMRQASSFLLIAKPNYLDIKEYLFSQLDNLEPKFERGEVLISLLYVSRNQNENEEMNKQLESMNNTIKEKLKLEIDDIFELNWHSKFAFACFKTKFKNKKELAKYSNLLYNKINNIFSYDNLDNLQTNYLAVFFEALSSLYHLLESNANIKHMITILFCKLMKRFENGLFKFTDGSARLDITGHVLNGFLALKNK